MKKFALIISTVLLTSAMFSQNLISIRGGVTKHFETGSPTFFGPGVSFQRGINQNIALGAAFDYQFGENSQYWMSVEPKFDYYFNGVFNGFHVGSKLAYTIYGISTTFAGITVSASTGQMHVGASAGYTHPLSDKMVIDISSGFGYTLFSGKGQIGVSPALSFGFKL